MATAILCVVSFLSPIAMVAVPRISNVFELKVNNSPKETKVGRAKLIVEIPSELYRMIIPACRLDFVGYKL